MWTGDRNLKSLGHTGRAKGSNKNGGKEGYEFHDE